MKHNSLMMLVALAVALWVTAFNRNAVPAYAIAQASGEVLTTAMRDEYVKLAKAKASEAAVQDWARKNDLVILSKNGYDIVVIRKQAAPPGTSADTVVAPNQYPPGAGFVEIKNSQKIATGIRGVLCPMKKCSWRQDGIMVCIPGYCSNTGMTVLYQ
jgi:hypothetical protein